MNKLSIAALMLGFAIVFTSCKEKEKEKITPEDNEKTSGFAIHTAAGTRGNISNFLTYYESMPTGEVDNSNGKSFQRFWTRMRSGNYILSADVNGASNNVSKIMFDEKGVAFEKTKLATLGRAYYGAVKDKNTAYTYDYNDNAKAIIVFDPATMKEKARIDMSKAFYNKKWESGHFEGFVIRGNDLFVSNRGILKNGNLDGDSLVYHHIDLGSNTYKSSFYFPNACNARNQSEPWVDESGNIFVCTDGNVYIPNVKPTILKIPAGSTKFDPNYNFKLIDKVSPTASQLPVQASYAFNYYKEGKAYANVSTSFPPELLQLIGEKGKDFGQWTPSDFAKAFQILNTAANGQYVEIDVNAQTVKVIEGIPGMSPLNAAIEIIGDKVYFVVASAKDNSVYEYDPATGKAKKAFDVKGGGAIRGFFKLKK